MPIVHGKLPTQTSFSKASRLRACLLSCTTCRDRATVWKRTWFLVLLSTPFLSSAATPLSFGKLLYATSRKDRYPATSSFQAVG